MINSNIFILFLLICRVSWAQNPIDYSPKELYHELTKFNGPENSELPEIKQIEGTANPVNDLDHHSRAGKYFYVKHSSVMNPIKYIYLGRVNSCRTGGCSSSWDPSENTEHEYFDYFILFDDAPSVRMVKVYNYQASHGQEITAKGWLKQFTGYDGKQDLAIGKNIDAISGATISVYAITIDVQDRLEEIRENVSPQLGNLVP